MRPRLSYVITAALLLFASPALASVVVPVGLDDLVGRAERIALARVEMQTARWTADHTAIYTEITLRLLQAMKGGGRAGDTLTMRREGGEADGMGMKVWGAASFGTGEEVVVFLERRGGALWTVGMAQGKMHVETVKGRKLAYRQRGGLSYLPGAKVPAEPSVQPLDELLADIAARVAGSR